MRPLRSRRSDFEAFVVAHGDGLVRLAYAISGDRGRAEDAVQEALTRLYERWWRLDGDPLPYARRMVVNRVRDDWRRGVREDRANAATVRSRALNPEDPHQLVPEHAALVDALAQLSDRQRAVIALRYLNQLTEAETAAVLELSIGTVKSYTARALTHLRGELAGGLVASETETR